MLTAAGLNAVAQSPPKYKGNCTDAGCHDGYARKPVVHDPVSQDSCDACHEEKDTAQHKFEFAEDAAELCESCHDEQESKVRHDPAANGECVACHDPHASDTKNLLRARTDAELCGECHDEVTEDLAYLHGPVAAGACTVCHDPHGSDHSAMLLAPEKDVCEGCHTRMQARIQGETVKHAPAGEGCTSCHNPHGADNRMNLTEEAPELCVDCHDDIGDLMEEANVTHDALTTGRSCANCHDPHASNVGGLLLAESMDLCLSCHDKPLNSGDGELSDIKALLAENKNHHGPIQQQDCSGCHTAHGGEHFRLLTEAYPAEFYAPFAEERYALCFDCHESDLVKEAETDEATNFRNGEQNLHHLHVHRTPKGRTCRACHSTHASRQPRHIAESVRFASWDLPLNFQKTETGGACQPGCHRLYRYDRTSVIANVR